MQSLPADPGDDVITSRRREQTNSGQIHYYYQPSTYWTAGAEDLRGAMLWVIVAAIVGGMCVVLLAFAVVVVGLKVRRFYRCTRSQYRMAANTDAAADELDHGGQQQQLQHQHLQRPNDGNPPPPAHQNDVDKYGTEVWRHRRKIAWRYIYYGTINLVWEWQTGWKNIWLKQGEHFSSTYTGGTMIMRKVYNGKRGNATFNP